MRKIPKKNYIILFVVVLFTLLTSVYLRNYYISKEKQANGLQIKNVYQIDEKSLNNYIIENGDFILYVADREQLDLKTFEHEFGAYLTKKGYTKDIIYLDLENVSDNFYRKFKSKYFEKSLLKKDFTKQTNLIYFENKKVKDILYIGKKETNIEDFHQFIDKYNTLVNEL